MRTILYYDPLWVKPTHHWVDGRLTRYRKSTNPGMWPEIWQALSPKWKAYWIERYKEEKRGVYAEHPGGITPDMPGAGVGVYSGPQLRAPAGATAGPAADSPGGVAPTAASQR